jgi:hypothetical protein
MAKIHVTTAQWFWPIVTNDTSLTFLIKKKDKFTRKYAICNLILRKASCKICKAGLPIFTLPYQNIVFWNLLSRQRLEAKPFWHMSYNRCYCPPELRTSQRIMALKNTRGKALSGKRKYKIHTHIHTHTHSYIHTQSLWGNTVCHCLSSRTLSSPLSHESPSMFIILD